MTSTNKRDGGEAAAKWDHVETERRKAAFNAWVRTQANKQGFRLMPPGYQGIVHGMLRLAFYAGSNWQRRHGAKAPQQPTGECQHEWVEGYGVPAYCKNCGGKQPTGEEG